ncbi:MAG: cytoplasmic protein [Elusimicrobia bacterium RIFCSPLOWO2_02_FULL_39_32]|nr:MAG: cytoplasmic protein [Elusimicrobia bacterium RIFCSPHIGHO2_02_FULL_39_36]OGR92421.1 MAG: cytoplasmic protein [Elusimicrobia bacterium RIFCSPLOWO2_02_FULL_39_32]OGR98963.1 MAG: cytoplasmic protein [Elusimicrobia bacterium RIFCSPLOWO2_12_FULL_39_28]
MKKNDIVVRSKNQAIEQSAEKLIGDIRNLISSARNKVAQTVNFGIVMLNWHIGKRIREDVLKNERAEYGKKIVVTLSHQLSKEYGAGFTRESLSRMIQFVERFPRKEIVATLSQQLSWSHFIEIIPLDDSLKRDFYAEMCRIERWSVRILRGKIDSMLYERTALSKKPAKLAALEIKKLRDEDKLSPDLVFRDPYFLEFLGLKGAYQEKDLESAILREMESFILELGAGFTFVDRQKRLQVGNKDYYLDLLFYHRKLKRLVAIELKLGRFKPEYKGQMELYLRWLEKHEQQADENPPIGLILCAGKDHEEIELLQLDQSGIRVAEYMTELPPRKVLEKKLHEAIHLARERLTQDPQ